MIARARIVKQPQSRGVDILKNVSLECEAVGKPPPTVSWSRSDGLPINFTEGRFKLVDSGTLFIHGSLSLSSQHHCNYCHWSLLKVLYAPRNEDFVISTLKSQRQIPISSNSKQGRRNSRLHSASTRRGPIQLPKVRTSTGQLCFAFHGPPVSNSLPSTCAPLLRPSPLRDSAHGLSVACMLTETTILY